MLKNSLFQPSLSFCFITFLPFSTSAAAFLFSLFRLPFFSLQRSFFFFCLFFQPYLFKVQPFTCCSLTQPKQPKRFLAFQPKRFCFSSATLSSFFSTLFFSDSAQKCYIQPKTFFFFSLGCPLFFSLSVQLKTFFSCFMSLYLSKSSFSSNLK